jgi:hypothetical protein
VVRGGTVPCLPLHATIGAPASLAAARTKARRPMHEPSALVRDLLLLLTVILFGPFVA